VDPLTCRCGAQMRILTENTYLMWVKRFIYYHNVKHPAEPAAADEPGTLNQ